MRKTAKKLKAAFAEGLTAASENTAVKTKKTASESTVKKSSRDSLTVVNIAPSNELLERINKSKYSVIRDYLIEKFYGETFVLSDGINAIMDKRDALELSHKASDLKSATLSI